MYGRPLVKSGSSVIATRPASEVDAWPYSCALPLVPKTESSATLAILAGFWSLEPSTRGSQTWTVPQPRPVFGEVPVADLGPSPRKQIARPP